ncbi:unnamed protein product [Staurois parvus]|uniref:Uncharacterized protein n=1 Tax=Staurois parvus TaxID=386267 RepID=A0ABN9G5I7_9NEOB|nr:unnamed protein product [Staurois parvus]
MARSLQGEQVLSVGFEKRILHSIFLACPHAFVLFSLSREGGGLVRVKLKGKNISA